MIKNDNREIQRELEIDKSMDSCINDELVNRYTCPLGQMQICSTWQLIVIWGVCFIQFPSQLKGRSWGY